MGKKILSLEPIFSRWLEGDCGIYESQSKSFIEYSYEESLLWMINNVHL